jgi:tetratricopeptide (TPR) repeat protein
MRFYIDKATRLGSGTVFKGSLHYIGAFATRSARRRANVALHYVRATAQRVWDEAPSATRKGGHVTFRSLFWTAATLIALSAAAIGGQSRSAIDTWNRRAAGADYQPVLEVSGREELGLFLERAREPQNLRSICEGRREAIDIAIPTQQQYLKSLLGEPAAARDYAEVAWTHRSLGQLWAYVGSLSRAAEEFGAAYAIALKRQDTDPRLREALAQLEAMIGVAHLRRGELENCIEHHHAASCIFPIREQGRHKRTSGSEQAMEHFLKHLARRPDNLEIRWLLNVAAMTLGRHPDAVPERWRLPPTAFASDEDPGRFEDVANEAGLRDIGRAGGAVIEDYDGDGRLDIFVSSTDVCASARLYLNAGGGRFEDHTTAAGLAEQLGGLNATHTDFNNDGRIDIFVMRGGWEYPMRNSLLQNDRKGTFTDVTAPAGLSSALHRTHSAAWADFDNDGWLDVFVAHEETRAALFRNNRDGTFTDVAERAGVRRTAFSKGAVWGDYDNDRDADLYVSNYGEPNFFYVNNGDGTFTERAAELGVAKPIMSFPTWFFDFDNDGWLDLFVASFVPSVTEVVRHYVGLPPRAETFKLYRNDRRGGFEDVTNAVGLARVAPVMGANFGDLDNDGFLDVYLGTGAPSYAAIVPNLMFRNVSGRRFADVTNATGTGHLQKGHGIAWADIDDDGDLDIYANIGGFLPGDVYSRALFRNPGHGNGWLRVRLEGVKSNRPGLGAKIRLVLPDGSLRYREVTGGGSFGASPLEQHIGVGKFDQIKQLEIEWPASGTKQTFTDVRANQRIVVREGENSYRIAGR